MTKSSPGSFIAIVDKDGDLSDTCTLHDDIIQSMIRMLDKKNPEDAPHSALCWDGVSSWKVWL